MAEMDYLACSQFLKGIEPEKIAALQAEARYWEVKSACEILISADKSCSWDLEKEAVEKLSSELNRLFGKKSKSAK